MLSGEVEVKVGQNLNRLAVGDSLHFNSSLVHTLKNPGDANHRAVWSYSTLRKAGSEAMAFVLTEEQVMIQTMARDFAREVLLPTAASRDRSHEFPRENLLQMGELGFMGMMVPEKYGGVGVDTVSYALALSEIAYGCASTAVVMSVHNSICCEAFVRFGSEEQKQHWLPQMTSGECIGAFALTEPGAGSDPSSQRTSAVLEGDQWVLNGTKQFITTGKNAGVVIVTAVNDKNKRHRGISAFLVPQGTPGMSVSKVEDKLGLKASDTVQLVFEDCRIPRGQRVGQARRRLPGGHDLPGRRAHRHRRPVGGRGQRLFGRGHRLHQEPRSNSAGPSATSRASAGSWPTWPPR